MFAFKQLQRQHLPMRFVVRADLDIAQMVGQ
jgi:hypothetical protein